MADGVAVCTRTPRNCHSEPEQRAGEESRVLVRSFAALLRNKPLGSGRLGEEGEAQSRRGTLEVTNRPLTEVMFIGLLTLRLIGRAMFEHMIENAGQLMCSGSGREGRPFTRPQPTV